MSQDRAIPDIDHLVFTAATLETGMDHIEKLLGVRPVPGGRHPAFGTHNALLSLGANTYLEVIAPDPEMEISQSELLFKEFFADKPRLARWVLRSEDIESVVARAADAGLDLGSISEGRRETTNGSMLSWKLTDPAVIPLEGAIPFLISWGDTPHPASVVPKGGKLVGFSIEHPLPQQVTEMLRSIDINMEVKKSEIIRLVAEIQTDHGVVKLY